MQRAIFLMMDYIYISNAKSHLVAIYLSTTRCPIFMIDYAIIDVIILHMWFDLTSISTQTSQFCAFCKERDRLNESCPLLIQTRLLHTHQMGSPTGVYSKTRAVLWMRGCTSFTTKYVTHVYEHSHLLCTPSMLKIPMARFSVTERPR